MKKVVFGCCLLGLMASCEGGKKRIDPFETLTKEIDSLGTRQDTVPKEEREEGEIIPVTADESFADFFYNFASDEQFQRSRIVFPISYYKGEQVLHTEKKDWKHDPLFTHAQVYTILFDKEEDMEMEKDTAVHSVQIDWIDLAVSQVKRYYFERVDNRWFLEAINKEPVSSDSVKGEDFLAFYSRFANDSVFQRRRLHEPLAFVTADPEDEFQILETTLDAGQWFAFRPPMMKGWLSNVHYGQKNVPHSETKIVEFKGFGNGFSNVLYFERRQGLWELMKLEDLSD